MKVKLGDGSTPDLTEGSQQQAQQAQDAAPDDASAVDDADDQGAAAAAAGDAAAAGGDGQDDAAAAAEAAKALAAGDGADAGDADEVIVSIGDEAPPEETDDAKAAPWVRELRRTNRELVRKQREQEAELARLRGAASGQPAAVVVGQKPTLEGCDYDAEKFEQELEAWHNRKREADAQAKKQQEAEEQAKAAWQKKLDVYAKSKTELKVPDFEDAEATALQALSVVQQGVILKGAKNATLLVYALGKNPKVLKDLAAITDPVEFAFAAADLENKLKITPRKTAPVPERKVQSSVPKASTTDNVYERLVEEAARTGDATKLQKYRREQRSRQAA